VRPLTEQQVRRSLVNRSRGEANGRTLPRGFDALEWAELEMLGRRDPKAPLREETPEAVASTTATLAENAAHLARLLEAPPYCWAASRSAPLVLGSAAGGCPRRRSSRPTTASRASATTTPP
jgi:hypothetical protein